VIAITWIANDDNPLPANPINIAYGIPGYWTTTASDEVNDGIYLWDTVGVACPGTYWINISVYDSVGQTTFDKSNYSFDINCIDFPPVIEVWEPGGTSGQTHIQGDIIEIIWTASDDWQLSANSVGIAYGRLQEGWATISTDEANDGSYYWDSSNILCPGTYWINLSVQDSKGQIAFDIGNYSFNVSCPVKGEYNWKPLVAFMFTILLLIIGTLLSYKRPLKLIKRSKEKRIYTWIITVFPFMTAEIATGIVSYFTGLLSMPPFFGIGIAIDLTLLIAGLATFMISYMKYGEK
jgi:hypothetical protein